MTSTGAGRAQSTHQSSGTPNDLIDRHIADLVDLVRSSQSRIDAAKAELCALLEQRGESWSDDEGYARLVADGVRTSYDRIALDRLILDDPLRYGWLKDYRTEQTVRGGVQVR